MTVPEAASESARIAALEAKIARLESLLPPPTVSPPGEVAGDGCSAEARNSRRHVLRSLALAAAGGAMASTLGRSDDAAAAHDPEDLGIGITNTIAAALTRLDTDTAIAGVGVLFQAVHGNTGLDSTDSDFAAALGGWSVSTAQPHGVYGFTDQAGGHGVIGVGEDAGVLGRGDTGVRGEGAIVGGELTSTTGTALTASGRVGAMLSGTDVALRLAASDKVLAQLLPDTTGGTTKRSAPPTRTTAHQRGMLDLDTNYDLWLCVADGTPGTWRKITGPTAAGAFHALTPGRVYDSRTNLPGPATPLTLGANRTVSVAGRRDLTTGEVVQTDFVPAGATAITCNLTVVSTTGAGYLIANPGGVTVVNAATINWSTSGQILNNGVILALNASRELTVVAGGSSGSSAHFIIDVTGYYR